MSTELQDTYNNLKAISNTVSTIDQEAEKIIGRYNEGWDRFSYRHEIAQACFQYGQEKLKAYETKMYGLSLVVAQHKNDPDWENARQVFKRDILERIEKALAMIYKYGSDELKKQADLELKKVRGYIASLS